MSVMVGKFKRGLIMLLCLLTKCLCSFQITDLMEDRSRFQDNSCNFAVRVRVLYLPVNSG